MRSIQSIALLITACGGALAQEQPLAAPVEDVLSALSKYNDEGKPRAQRVAFEFPAVVVNAYLATALNQRPRPGIEKAAIKLLPGNRVGVDASINLDSLAERPKGLPEDMKGIQPAAMELAFQIVNGSVKLTCEKFLLAEKPLPGAVASELIRIIGAMQPEKFDTSRPVPLPFGLNKLSTTSGTVTGDTSRVP